jgi:hypothetical protein
MAGTPTAHQLREANDLLGFVEGQWPQLKPTTDYKKAYTTQFVKDLKIMP